MKNYTYIILASLAASTLLLACQKAEEPGQITDDPKPSEGFSYTLALNADSFLLLSAKPQSSESNSLICRNWASYLYETSPYFRFVCFLEAIPRHRQA